MEGTGNCPLVGHHREDTVHYPYQDLLVGPRLDGLLDQNTILIGSQVRGR